MDCITVLAQAYETSSAQASDAVVPIDTFWKYIRGIRHVLFGL